MLKVALEDYVTELEDAIAEAADALEAGNPEKALSILGEYIEEEDEGEGLILPED